MIETTGVTGRYEVQRGRLLGMAARRLTVCCAHVESTAYLLPADDPASDVAAFDLLWTRHTGQHGCACAPATDRD